jgi:hypothetical protein
MVLPFSNGVLWFVNFKRVMPAGRFPTARLAENTCKYRASAQAELILINKMKLIHAKL